MDNEKKVDVQGLIEKGKSQGSLANNDIMEAVEFSGYDVDQIEKIYGVATFYAQFALAPKGEHEVSVCLGTACYVKGSQAIYDKISEVLDIGEGECTPDRKFSLVSCRCVGACGLAPVMMVEEDVYGRMTTNQVEDVLNKYR